MTTPLAVPDELVSGGWLPTVPDNAAALIRRASQMVRAAIRFAVYDVDTLGVPTGTAVIEALRDATCAQAAEWSAAGFDPLTARFATGGTGAVAESSINGATIKLATDPSTSVTALGDRIAAAGKLCGEARDILTAAGLAPVVWSTG